MIHYDFQRSVGFWAGTATHEIERALNRALSSHGITLSQVRLLACLALAGDLAQHELAEMLSLDRSTVARAVDRMERDGWVARRTHPKDRRQKTVSATEKVRPYWDHIVREGEAIESIATQGISENELTVMRSVCGRIINNLNTHSAAIHTRPATVNMQHPVPPGRRAYA